MSPEISSFDIEIRGFCRFGRTTPNGGWLAKAKIEEGLEDVIFLQVSNFNIEFGGFLTRASVA